MEDEILRLARDRAAALAASDATELTALLHERFVWTSHRGDRFAREEYVVRNVGGAVRWCSQDLVDPSVVRVGDAAVLTAMAIDVIDGPSGVASYRMPVTQTWVRDAGRWQLLAGHAGPALD